MNLAYFLSEIIFFIVIIFWFIQIPGYLCLNLLKTSLTRIEIFTVSLVFGSVIFALALLLFGLLKIPLVVYLVLTVFNLIVIGRNRKKIFVQIKNLRSLFIQNNLIIGIVLIFCTLLSGSLLLRSGLQSSNGLIFTEYRDAFWHLGLMRELVRSIPPVHPGFSDLPLTNYHFFTHLFGAGFLYLPLLNHLDFYFRLFPFFLIFLYCLTLFIVGRKYTKTILGANLSVFFGIFTGSFAYLLPFFIKNIGDTWHESSFWLSQPFTMVINPSFALSSSLLMTAIFLFHKIYVEKDKKLTIVFILISGTLIAFKVYAGLLMLAGLLTVGLWVFIKQKNMSVLLLFFYSLIFSLLVFLPANGNDASKFLVFMPGWYLRSMAESPDRVPIIDWILRENTYALHGNILGVLRYRFYEFVIYLVGNFGIRIFGLFFVIKSLKKLAAVSVFDLFTITIALTGFIIPLLFVQDGSIANTLQFSYYSLEIASLFFVLWILSFLKKKSPSIKIVVIAFFIFLAVPTSIKTWGDYLINPSSINISTETIDALYVLERNSNLKDTIIVPGTSQYTTSLFVGTLSNRRLYYSDRLMAENTHKDFRKREKMVNKFYFSQDKKWNSSFLKENKIRYVYLDHESIKNFEPANYPLEPIFKGNQIEIYKVI